MKRNAFWVLLALPLLTTSVEAAADNLRIYGRVQTKSGKQLEGPIRWDRNEGSWFDLLDGSKQLPERNREASKAEGLEADRKSREIRILGIKIFDLDSMETFPSSAQSAIRFGHIDRLESIDSRSARLILKSGEEVVLRGGSDIGRGVRGIIVEDRDEGLVELDWSDLEAIDFLRPSQPTESELGRLLYGTVLTKSGAGFTGFICWDVDELFTTDILDGRDSEKEWDVEFGEIATIQNENSRSARVTLKSGRQLVLSGTNDVNSENRGILILEPSIGQVRVSWKQFEKLVLTDIPASIETVFDGGRRLAGTVTTEEHQYSGLIRWDNDEEYTWEMLGGRYEGIEFEIEFGLIRSIEKSSEESVVVTLRDGRAFQLSGSNDVDSDNKGIFVELDGGGEKAVSWTDFRSLELKER